MSIDTRIKTRNKGGYTEVLVLVKHPMETGQRKDGKTKQLIPAHYIQKLTFELNDKVVAEAHLGLGVAAHPLTGIVLKEAKSGDKVTVSWVDNKGQSNNAEATVR